MYGWNWGVVLQYKFVFIQGALVTLGLTVLVVLLGSLVGLVVGLLRKSSVPLLPTLAKIYTEIFRALPILVLLIWLYYVSPILIGVQFSPFVTALLALSIHLSAFVAETVRAAIESIPKAQYESGLTLGLSPAQTMGSIILPQAFKNMLPNLMGLYVTELKNTSLASVIAVNELLHRANSVISNTFRPLEVYTAVAVMYLIVILPITYFVGVIERRLGRNLKTV